MMETAAKILRRRPSRHGRLGLGAPAAAGRVHEHPDRTPCRARPARPGRDLRAFFWRREKPDFIFIAAAKVGGIQANNTLRAEFIYQNLMVEAN
jgi:hypothetical protein